MNFLNLFYKFNAYEISFEGIKVFQTDNPNKFTIDFLKQVKESKFVNVNIFKNNTIVISDFTRIEDLISLSKSSYIFKEIINYFENFNILNNEKILDIKNHINNKIGFEVIEEKNELQKIVANIFEVNDLIQINKNVFLSMMKNNIFEERTTFLFCDIDWICINDISEFINDHNFIFITNDLRKNINNITQIESCVICNDKLLEIYDYNKLISYIELKMNTSINNEIIESYLKNEDKPGNFFINSLIKFIK